MEGASRLAALAVVVALSICAGVCAHDPAPSLELLIADRNMDLTRRHQLLALAEEAQTRVMPDYIKQALVDLAALLEVPQEDLCAKTEVLRVRDYYVKHLLEPRHKSQLPKALRDFAVAHGMKLSNLCAWTLFEALKSSVNGLLNETDVGPLDKILENDKLVNLVGGIDDYAKIVLPQDVIAQVRAEDRIPTDKLYVQSDYTNLLRRIKTVCEQRLEPIYDQLLMPSVILARIGYRWTAQTRLTSLREPHYKHYLARWSRVVSLCENLKRVQPIDSFQDENLSHDQPAVPGAPVPQSSVESGPYVFRLLTKEEAEEIQEKFDIGKVRVVSEPVQLDAKLLRPPSPLPELILDKSDRKLEHAVKRVRTLATALVRNRGTILATGFDYLMKLLRKYATAVLSVRAKAAWQACGWRHDHDLHGSDNVRSLLHRMIVLAEMDESKREPHEQRRDTLISIGTLGLVDPHYFFY